MEHKPLYLSPRFFLILIILLAVSFSFPSWTQELPVEKTTIKSELAEPFSYFLVPSDVLGFKSCPEGTQITYDGAFNTVFGEFDIFAGSKLKPVNKRVKTLYRGYLPVIEYSFERDSTEYSIQAFAVPRNLDPRNDLINFIRITAKNRGQRSKETEIKVLFTDPHGRSRYLPNNRENAEWYHEQFINSWVYVTKRRPYVKGGEAWRGRHLVFLYSPPRDTNKIKVQPAMKGTVVSGPSVLFKIELQPGESRSVYFKLPYVPIFSEKKEEIALLKKMDYDDYFTKTVTFWEDELNKGMVLSIPDPKVENTIKSSLIYLMIARDITKNGKFIQKVNEFQYDFFYPRDVSYITRMYDMYNRPDMARESLDHFIVYDRNGRPKKFRSIYPDDWGQVLWAMGAHFRATGDLDFARFIYPLIPPHFNKFIKLCKTDPLGLWPVAGPYDNEAISGHYTGHSFWALLGMKEAINIARALGKDEDARRFQKVYDEYYNRFIKVLRNVAAKAEGYIPPGLDDPNAGYDWANVSGGVYPFELLNPFDPLVTATVNMVREFKYQEGIMTYGPNAWVMKQNWMKNDATAFMGWLHHYETFYELETLLAREEQRKVVEDMYSFLAHTSSTNAGFEFSILPWGDRDPHENYPPHGWCAARYCELLRNMFLRERGDTLHFASVLAPKWVEPGKTVQLKNGATFFGDISYTIKSHKKGADVEIAAKWRRMPKKIIFHTPWFLNISGAIVNGKKVKVKNQAFEIPPETKYIRLKWKWNEKPGLTYKRAVEILIRKMHRLKPTDDRSFLFPTPRPPKLRGRTTFTKSMNVNMFIPGGIGKIYYTLDGSEPDEKSKLYEEPFKITNTTVLKAITIWDNGRRSESVSVRLEKLAD